MTTPIEVMRSLIGQQWSSGPPSPAILAWEELIATTYPEMANYIRAEERTYIAWCGLAVAYCLAKCGIRPPNEFLWADSYRTSNYGTDASSDPQQGDIIVFKWLSGQHHVTFLDRVEGSNFVCLGGNQSHEVRDSTFERSSATAVRRPPAAQTQPQPGQPPAVPPGDDAHPLIATGDTGAAVVELQHRLGIPEDGDFGDTTRWTTKGYQLEHGLDADGEVGPLTWGSLLGTTQVTPSQPTHTLSDGAAICRKLLDRFSISSIAGIVPSDAAQFGITTGMVSQWAIFGTAVCAAESGFNPRSANTSDPGGSFGIFQYAHNQVPGGNAYDIDASVSAFVRDAERSAKSGSLQRGILGQRFSTIGRHPERTVAQLSKAARFAAEAQQAMPLSPQPAPAPAPRPAPPPGPQPMPTPAPNFSDLQQEIAKLIATLGAVSQPQPPAPAPAPAPAAQPPPAAPATMGIEHLGILGLLTTIATHFTDVAPVIGPNASPAAQIVAAISTFMLGSGFMSRIGPTLGAVVRFLSRLSPPESK